MKRDLTYLHDMLAKLDCRLDDIHDVQVRQEAVLEEHQRRSLANEEAVAVLSAAIKPVEAHVLLVNYTIKIISIVGGALLLAATIWQAVK